MLIVGLTGGIATGKSTVAKYLKSRGLTLIDADREAHLVLNFSFLKLQILNVDL